MPIKSIGINSYTDDANITNKTIFEQYPPPKVQNSSESHKDYYANIQKGYYDKINLYDEYIKKAEIALQECLTDTNTRRNCTDMTLFLLYLKKLRRTMQKEIIHKINTLMISS